MGIDSDSGEYGLQEEAHAALNGLLEQLEAAHRGMQELIIKNDRLGAACEAADRLLDDVYAKGDKHEDDLLRVRAEVSAALATAYPASMQDARMSE